MARIRYVKPEFFLDERISALDPLDRLVYLGIACIADKAGRLEERPAKMAVQILPYEQAGFKERISRLVSASLLIRYEADGKRLLQVRAWQDEQKPHPKEAESKLPAPEPLPRSSSR